MRKVLSVAIGRIDVEYVYNALIRSRRSRNDRHDQRIYPIEPPRSIVLATLRKIPWISIVQYDDLILNDYIDPASVLSDTELDFLQFFKGKGGFASKTNLMEHYVNSGKMNQITMEVALNYSAIICKLDFGIYGLLGWPLSQHSLIAALNTVGGAENKAKRDMRNIHSDENGWVVFEIVISEYMYRNKVFEMPATISNKIPRGEYQVRHLSKSVTLTKTPSGANRLLRFITLAVSTGLMAGDKIQIQIEPQTKELKFQRL